MASNHIGRPEDIPQRALIALKADLVIFEEDKPATTLKAAGIHRDYLKFNEHHQQEFLTMLALHLKRKDRDIHE